MRRRWGAPEVPLREMRPDFGDGGSEIVGLSESKDTFVFADGPVAAMDTLGASMGMRMVSPSPSPSWISGSGEEGYLVVVLQKTKENCIRNSIFGYLQLEKSRRCPYENAIITAMYEGDGVMKKEKKGRYNNHTDLLTL